MNDSDMLRSGRPIQKAEQCFQNNGRTLGCLVPLFSWGRCGRAALLIASILLPQLASADEPYIRDSAERFEVVTHVRAIANPRTSESVRQQNLDQLAEIIETRHESLADVVLLINWIFDDYRYRCRNPIVRSTIAAINQIEIYRTDYRLRIGCNNRSRDQGIRTILQIEDL